MIAWTEPFTHDIPHILISCTISKEDAIEIQHILAEEIGIEYDNDKEALIDFMASRGAIDTDNEILIGADIEAFTAGH